MEINPSLLFDQYSSAVVEFVLTRDWLPQVILLTPYFVACIGLAISFIIGRLSSRRNYKLSKLIVEKKKKLDNSRMKFYRTSKLRRYIENISSGIKFIGFSIVGLVLLDILVTGGLAFRYITWEMFGYLVLTKIVLFYMLKGITRILQKLEDKAYQQMKVEAEKQKTLITDYIDELGPETNRILKDFLKRELENGIVQVSAELSEADAVLEETRDEFRSARDVHSFYTAHTKSIVDFPWCNSCRPNTQSAIVINQEKKEKKKKKGTDSNIAGVLPDENLSSSSCYSQEEDSPSTVVICPSNCMLSFMSLIQSLHSSFSTSFPSN